jgi:thiamine-phosphate pyrophosphorylase
MNNTIPDKGIKTISRLQYLTQDHIPGMTHALLAEEACRGGIDWIQLRTKKKSEKQWEAVALSVL